MALLHIYHHLKLKKMNQKTWLLHPRQTFMLLLTGYMEYPEQDDLAKTEEYKLGSGPGHDPQMFQMEESSHPSSLKFPIMDDIVKLLQHQDNSMKPRPTPVNIFGFCKCLIGNFWQRLKNDGYENHL